MDDDDDGVSLQKSYSKKRDPGGDVRSYRFSLDTMNNSVAEAARRIFGHLPHSTCRTGTKYLRKNSIGIKIAAVSKSLFSSVQYTTSIILASWA